MTTPTQVINATDLTHGMHLCYRVTELLTMGVRQHFLRNEQLVGEVVLVGQPDEDDNILVTLGYGRSFIVGKYDEREIEIVEREPALAHRGTPAMFKGISLE